MSGSRCVITPLWLSGSLRSFMSSTSVCSCHLFLISSLLLDLCHFSPLLCPSLHEIFPCCAKSLQLCPTVQPHGLQPTRLLRLLDSPGKNIGVGCHAVLQNVPLVSPIFLKRSLVFPILLFSSISLHCSPKKAFFSPLAILWNSAFSWVYLSLSPLLFTSLLFIAWC